MATIHEPEIGGLPANLFLRRRVRIKTKSSVKHHIPAVVHGIDGDRILVQSSGHKETFLVNPGQVHPWWAQNPDLADILKSMAAADLEINPKCLKAIDTPHTEVEVTPVATIVLRQVEPPQPETEEPQKPKTTPEPIMQNTPQPAFSVNLPLTITDHTQDWLPAYQGLQRILGRRHQSEQLIREAQDELRKLDEEVIAQIQVLEGLGVSVCKPEAKVAEEKSPFGRVDYGKNVAKWREWAQGVKAEFARGKERKQFPSFANLCKSGPGLTLQTIGKVAKLLDSEGIVLRRTGKRTVTLTPKINAH